MRGRRIVVAAALGMVALAGVTGCSSGGSGGSSGAKAPSAAESAGGSGSGTADRGAGAQGQPPVSADQRRVVRSAQLSVRVDDVAAATREVAAVAPRFGGYVAAEDSDDSRATVQLKVESARLDEALAVLGDGIGEVTSRSQQAIDVTEEAVDLQARVGAQRASVDRVRTLLANATSIGEIVEIESELTTRQAELDSLEQRLAALSGRVELADVSVTIHRSSTPIEDDEDDTGFLAGLSAGWGLFTGAVEAGLTVLGALLPFAITLAVPATVVAWLVRRNRKPAPKAAAATAGPSGPPPATG